MYASHLETWTLKIRKGSRNEAAHSKLVLNKAVAYYHDIATSHLVTWPLKIGKGSRNEAAHSKLVLNKAVAYYHDIATSIIIYNHIF